MRAPRIILAAVFGLVVAGCSHEPTADIDAARHSLDEARQAQAAEYAPESWTAAQDADSKLHAELDAQAQRWSALREYSTARELALKAKSTAEQSQQEAISGKDKAKTDASTLMAQANAECSRAKAALENAPKGKGTAVDLVSMKSDTISIDDTLRDMQRAFDAGDYLDAKTKAQAAMDAAKKIENEIEQARAARRAS